MLRNWNGFDSQGSEKVPVNMLREIDWVLGLTRSTISPVAATDAPTSNEVVEFPVPPVSHGQQMTDRWQINETHYLVQRR